jgi:hypothetical protein
MNKHILNYSKFLLLESADGETVKELDAFNEMVISVVNSTDDALKATEKIKEYIHNNIPDLTTKLADPEFISNFYKILRKWYDKYHKELDGKEIESLTDLGVSDDDFEDDGISDEFDSDEMDWEIEI